ADAHPLGNFSVNHLAVVSIARDAVDVRWILDQAEVPTFQERGLAPREVLARKRAAAEAGLALRVDGRAVALRPVGAGRIAFPPGQGGLRLTRVELRFRASAVGARRVVLLAFLLAAFGWGALHALSPGHGKAMVAASLVGTRGTARQAVLLGATVTVTHTIGVFALGLVTLALSDFILPEDLYPWLNLVAGAMVVGVGVAVLRSRMRHAHPHAHPH